MYFTADNGINGRELWRSDGTSAGTYMVKDINPGFTGSNPSNLIDVNGVLFFTATTPGEGTELWRTDGTSFGTALVNDIRVGASSSNIATLAVLNGILYFRATNNTNGSELWRSNGTAVGTTIVRDIVAGSGSSTPTNLTRVGNFIFFSAFNSTNGFELWKTDGTANGTVLVKDINSGTVSSFPSSLTDVAGTLFFTANDPTNGSELWKSDGTTNGTVLVKDINPGTPSSGSLALTAIGSTLFFTATNDGITNYNFELWRSDGTTAGTLMVKDINLVSSSNPTNMILYNGVIYFRADNGINGYELWKTDGTNAGTVLVKDIFPGFNQAQIFNFAVFGSELYFFANDGINGNELWKTDGTNLGTVMVKDINPGVFSGAPQYLTVYNGALFFTGNDGTNGVELHKSDGTATGTVMVKDINTSLSGFSSFGADPTEFTIINNKLYFSANDLNTSTELWQTDGTTAGTTLFKDINEGYYPSYPSKFISYNNATYFTAITYSNGNELWKTDGTEVGTVMVKDFYGISYTNYGNIVVANGSMIMIGQVYNASNVFTGYAIYKSDGTANGTVKVVDLPGLNSPGNLTAAGNLVYFNFNDGTGTNLWRTDGTVAGTMVVNPSLTGLNPNFIIAVGNQVFFRGTTASNGNELWKSDGTVTGTTMVWDIFPGTSSSFILGLTNINGTVYFSANDGVNGIELWKSDGTLSGTVLVRDINPGSNNSNAGQYGMFLGINPPSFFLVNGKIVFTATTSTNSIQLWSTDGTTAGTQVLSNIPVSNLSSNFAAYKDNTNKDFLFFTAGTSLWRTDGTVAGTFGRTENALIDALNLVNSIIIINNKMILTIAKPVLNTEPWVADIATVLPLNIVSFNASIQNTTVLTQWQTSNEVNVSHMNIQRSFDGIGFTSIGTVNAKGGGSYIYTDALIPSDVIKLYYRLESVDKDGSNQYSKIVTVNLAAKQQKLTIFPNPVKQTLTAQLFATKKEKVSIQIKDIQGKVLHVQQTELSKGNNAISIPTSYLVKGSYLLIINGEIKLQKQFIKE